MTNIILCGGSGTRLWPLSRKLMPKQFLKIFDDKSLFQLTINRNKKLFENLLIVSNEEQYFLALDQLDELDIKNSNFLLESIAKNTAPAIALACKMLDKEEIVLVTPSDHLIKNEIEYENVINNAKKYAKSGYIITFGITPTYAETGYGYIEAIKSNEVALDVKKFHEKPNLEIAKKYLSNKDKFFWNSGMFMFKAGVFLEELKKYSLEIYDAVTLAFENRKVNQNVNRILYEYMEKIPEDSIDYAVMEKSNIVKVIPSNINWDDVGSFDSLIKHIASKQAIEIDSKNNFYYSDGKKTFASIGVEDLIIIDTNDALLITRKNFSQKVKDVVNILKKDNKEIITTHKKVYRPWGVFETLITGKGYKIKRIIVKPKKRLSLQKHFHRNEHWIVVSGTAKVTVGNNQYLVRPNESTYIKMGEIHRLENPGKIPVILIEAQVGEYTGEDDIIRIEDDFKR
jgi:mannose-1-phosphate guanylyltransferase